ncbi:MAG: sodium:proton antiporter [Verrucomicrobiae bacterium]
MHLIFATAFGAAYEVNPWMILPFAALLLLIAAGPALLGDWWHHHYPKVSVGLGLLTLSYYFWVLHQPARFWVVAHEYASFIALIGSLFVAAGGIHINVKGESRPLTNVLFLAVGAVIANVLGTTGASMLLIRPWIRMNRYRITAFHIVFFLFIVSNVGGCLTPIGDPPLFLGYLKGVPFWWTLEHCWPAWAVAVGALLTVFYVADCINIRKAPQEVMERQTSQETWRFDGAHNLAFIAVILAAVLYNRSLPLLVPEAIMAAAAAASFFLTPKRVHEANDFSFAPIREVAWLFLGIFATMVPALDYLGMHAAAIGIASPIQFYYATGVLSAFLDNAPTYLAFLSTAMGLHQLSLDSPADVLAVVASSPREILAISLGAVFFGAMTYIGNGPNLMVKSIADHAKVRTPHFFAYIFRFALPILLPLLVLISILFFWPQRT